jgi:hypothetical protein
MSRDAEQLTLRTPPGTKARLLALRREGETLSAVVLRAIAALELQGLPKMPQEVPAGAAKGRRGDRPGNGLAMPNDDMEDLLGRLRRLEEAGGGGGTTAPRGGPMTASALLERIPDAARCEHQNADGSRCKRGAAHHFTLTLPDGCRVTVSSCAQHYGPQFRPHPGLLPIAGPPRL